MRLRQRWGSHHGSLHIKEDRTMRTRKLLAIAIVAMLAIGACTPAASPSPSASSSTPPASQPAGSQSAAPSTPASEEAVIEGVEAGAEIEFWTYYLSPNFDQYIEDTIARFEETYPGVTVNWEDHQDTFRNDLDASFAASDAPDVINLSVSEGWVSDYASRDLLLGLNDLVPDDVKSVYYEGLWNQQLVDGENFQFPWYQGISVALINTQIYSGTPVAGSDPPAFEGGAGLKVEDFPKTIDALPALCQTIKDKTGKLCDLRLTVSDLLAQMVYEGDVDIVSDDGTFTFDSPEAVAWLQMYVDMVAAGTVDRNALVGEDRVGLDLFTSGEAPFYLTGPNLIREVRANNPGLYGYLSAVQAPVGKSGVIGKGLMSISVKADTEFPNASIALAQFFTNPRSMLEFAKLVPVYPSTPASYDDPFFAAAPVAIEDSAKPIAKDIVATLADIVPTVENKAEVNEIVLQAVQEALFNNKPAQQALTDAVAAANALD
jgi:putative chitobiose transport system substrate-binding protein